MDIQVIDLNKNEVKKKVIDLPKKSDLNYQHIFYLINKYQNNLMRQGTHANKSRSDVSGGGSKPFKQKGTGRARRGTSRSPIIKGGGVVFAKKNRDYSINLNKKLFNQLYIHLFDVKKDDISIVSTTDELVKVSTIKNKLDITKKYLIIYDLNDYMFLKSTQNIKTFKFADTNFIPVIDFFNSDKIIFTETSFNQFQERFLK